MLKLSLIFASMASVASASAASAADVKIAMVETLSGPQASTGLMYRNAAKFGADQINKKGGWNGQPVEFLEFDNQGGPLGASDKVREAIADGAQIIVQGSSSVVSGQITEDIRKYNLRHPGNEVLFLNVGGEAMELTGNKCHFYHFRFAPNPQMRINALVKALTPLGALGKRVYSINQNYSNGRDVESAITEYAAAGGYDVVERTLHDVNKIQDFSPYVAKIAAANVDTVMTGNWSNDLLLLMKASHNAGLKVHFATTSLDQPGNIGNAQDAAEGSFMAQTFNTAATEPASLEFSEAYKTATGNFPVYVEPQAIFAMAMLGSALSATPPVNNALVVKSLAFNLENASIQSPLGTISVRKDDHQAVFPMVVSVVSKDAKYKADGTDFGFKPVKVFTAAEAAVPAQASCKMQRPEE